MQKTKKNTSTRGLAFLYCASTKQLSLPLSITHCPAFTDESTWVGQRAQFLVERGAAQLFRCVERLQLLGGQLVRVEVAELFARQRARAVLVEFVEERCSFGGGHFEHRRTGYHLFAKALFKYVKARQKREEDESTPHRLRAIRDSKRNRASLATNAAAATTPIKYLFLGELAVAVQVQKLKDFFEAQLAVGVAALAFLVVSARLALHRVGPQTRRLRQRHQMLTANLGCIVH